MKACFIIIFVFQFVKATSQQTDTVNSIINNPATQLSKAEILSGGSIDIVQNGQMNASARIFRLFIGEPGKFQVPVSLYTGVSSNSYSGIRQNEDYVLSLINPSAGTFNFFFEGDHRIIGKKQNLTSMHFQYQAGFRMMSAYLWTQQRNMQYLNTILFTGFSLTTAAWERNKLNNVGIFWLNIRLIYSRSPVTAIRDLFVVDLKPGILGYSSGMGIEISKTLKVKLNYFRFVTNRMVASFNESYILMSFNYSIR